MLQRNYLFLLLQFFSYQGSCRNTNSTHQDEVDIDWRRKELKVCLACWAASYRICTSSTTYLLTLDFSLKIRRRPEISIHLHLPYTRGPLSNHFSNTHLKTFSSYFQHRLLLLNFTNFITERTWEILERSRRKISQIISRENTIFHA